MKKFFIVAVALICSLVIFSSIFVSSASEKNAIGRPKNEVEIKLLSMLNHNFVYGADFDNADDVVNGSLYALSEYKDDSGEFINASLVAGFVNNMYGIDIVDFSNLNANCPKKNGYLYAGKGNKTVYHHDNPTLFYNEDGTITVTSTVSVEGSKKTYSAVSTFVPNEESSFGYNIISAEISDSTLSA